MKPSQQILSVAVPAPIYRTFDYLAPRDDKLPSPEVGDRVLVPFGHRDVTAIVIALSDSPQKESSQKDSAPSKFELKHIAYTFEEAPLITPKILTLIKWAAIYYCHPLGECMGAAIPAIAKKRQALPDYGVFKWHRTAKPFEGRSNAKQQLKTLNFVAAHSQGIWQASLKLINATPKQLASLEAKGYLEKTKTNALDAALESASPAKPVLLNAAQLKVSAQITTHAQTFGVSLLEGITGSGKTEVYIDLVEKTLKRGLQALVLIPEINLTPQTFERFQSQLSRPIGLLHSGLSEKEKFTTWSLAKSGQAQVVIGTRSAIFTPFKTLGLIIVDEEHDASYKQTDGFKYSARDLAVKRAHIEDCPIVLGSATPSIETLKNAHEGRYLWTKLNQRAGFGKPPKISLIDIKSRPLSEGCSPPLLLRIEQELAHGNQVIVFQNRRGYSPTLMCSGCGDIIQCQHCDARMTLHSQPPHMHCHHCDAKHAIPRTCANCQCDQLAPIGFGTERIEHGLASRFPDTKILRIDRDSIKNQKDMESAIEQIDEGKPTLIIGTQMLSKGHDFHHVTLVAIIDADGLFFSADFRAMERGAQQLLQVAGRSGRGKKAGEVLIQTRLPEHPIFEHIINGDYPSIGLSELDDRQSCELPPYTRMITIRAESANQSHTLKALEQIHEQVLALGYTSPDHNIAGPIEGLLSRKQGQYRSFLHIFSSSQTARTGLMQQLPTLVTHNKIRATRVTIDVDPLEYL